MALKEKIKERTQSYDNEQLVKLTNKKIHIEEDLCSELCFPLMYRDEGYYKLACKSMMPLLRSSMYKVS